MILVEVVKNIVVTLVTTGVLVINPLTVTGIMLSKKLRNEMLTIVLVSVFVTDFLQGLLLGVISTFLSWAEVIKPPVLLVRFHSCYIIATLANLMAVTLLAVLQTISVLRLFQFKVIWTRTRSAAALILTWIVAGILGILVVTSDKVQYTQHARISGARSKINTVVIGLMILIMVVCHGLIFGVVIKQQIKQRSMVAPGMVTQPNAVLAVFKSAKRILAVSLTYLVFYSVALVVLFCFPGDNTAFFSSWFAYSQGIWNSLFYLAFFLMKHGRSFKACSENVALSPEIMLRKPTRV